MKDFLRQYRRIPNTNHEIRLNDDGTVTMTMRGFRDTVRFLGVSMHGDG